VSRYIIKSITLVKQLTKNFLWLFLKQKSIYLERMAVLRRLGKAK